LYAGRKSRWQFTDVSSEKSVAGPWGRRAAGNGKLTVHGRRRGRLWSMTVSSPIFTSRVLASGKNVLLATTIGFERHFGGGTGEKKRDPERAVVNQVRRRLVWSPRALRISIKDDGPSLIFLVTTSDGMECHGHNKICGGDVGAYAICLQLSRVSTRRPAFSIATGAMEALRMSASLRRHLFSLKKKNYKKLRALGGHVLLDYADARRNTQTSIVRCGATMACSNTLLLLHQ